MKPVRGLASSRPKPCVSLKNAPGILPTLLVGPRRKKTDRDQRSAFLSETSRFARLILAHKGSALSRLVDDRDVL